jgi:hypothetical protein
VFHYYSKELFQGRKSPSEASLGKGGRKGKEQRKTVVDGTVVVVWHVQLLIVSIYSAIPTARITCALSARQTGVGDRHLLVSIRPAPPEPVIKVIYCPAFNSTRKKTLTIVEQIDGFAVVPDGDQRDEWVDDGRPVHGNGGVVEGTTGRDVHREEDRTNDGQSWSVDGGSKKRLKKTFFKIETIGKNQRSSK